MTYSTGSPILANDYNSFAAGMNEIFADTNQGATSLPGASYGYGQLPLLSSVLSASDITSAQWSALFDTMRKSGTHQGTTVVPPLPASDPIIGNDIISYAGVTALITTLYLSKFNIAVGQGALTSDSEAQPSTGWTHTLTYDVSINFNSWDQARYFFNTGGYMSLSGTYAPIVTPDDASWLAALTAMGTLRLQATSNTGTTPSVGFYNLTTSPTQIYLGHAGGGHYYSGNTITVDAKLTASPGTAGIIGIIFTVVLTDNDPAHHLPIKSGTTTYTVSNLCSVGAVPVTPPIWPPTHTFAST
jgi:hypothetical protein